jgi:uncharacterized protein (TIGR02145 family)
LFGFTALPAGCRGYGGSCYYLGEFAHFWSASEDDAEEARYQFFGYVFANVFPVSYYKSNEFSLRCSQD